MTAFTQTSIANMALGYLGEYRINDIDDNGPSEIVLRDYWDIARLDTLGAFEWGFASTILALTRNADAPDSGFQYKYDQPPDWVRTNKVSDSGKFEEGIFENWEYREGFFEADAETLYLDYVYDHKTVGTWPAWFVSQMAIKWAAYAAPGITSAKREAMELHKMADSHLLKAKARDAQQRVRRRPPSGNWYNALRGRRTWR